METPKVFYSNKKVVIINDDILTTNAIRPDSIDLIVTSPPYNVDIQYNSHRDDISYPEYLEFTHAWLSRCFQFLKDDGRFCLNIPLDKNKGGQQSFGADITQLPNKLASISLNNCMERRQYILHLQGFAFCFFHRARVL